MKLFLRFLLVTACASTVGVQGIQAPSSTSSALVEQTKQKQPYGTPGLPRFGHRLSIPDPAPEPLTVPPKAALSFKWMPLRYIYKLLNVYLVGGTMLYLMFVINTAFSLLFLVLKFWMKKIILRPFAGFMITYRMTPMIELCFDFGRMLTYFPFLIRASDKLFSYKWNMRSADELVGTQRIPSDDVFISHLLLRTPVAFYSDNQPDKYVVDMSAINTLQNYPETYYEVNRIEVDKKTSEIKIFTRSGGPISSKHDSRADFEKAKVHACQTMMYFIGGIAHSWVHFYFPDVVAAVVHNSLPRKSVLYRLMEPHTRYTSRINWEALGVRGTLVIGESALVRMAAEAASTKPRGQAASPFIQNMFITKMEPWAPFSMSAGEFVRKNSERTTDYYLNEESEEFACPPKWFDGPNAEIPYIKSIKRFYPIIRKHVARVLEYEDDATIGGFIAAIDAASEIDGRGLGLHRFDPIDVIASHIFDVVIIHSTDHFFTYEMFGQQRFGVGTLRHPYTADWFPGRQVPDDLCDGEDRVRAQNFLDVFVQFTDNKLFPNQMERINYKFRGDLENAGMDLVNEIALEQQKMKSEGDIFCPMDKLSRSICF